LSNRDNQTFGEKVALAAPANEEGKGGRKGKHKDEVDKPSTPARTNTFTSNPTPKGSKGGAKGEKGGGKSSQTNEPTTPTRKAACYFFHTKGGCHFGDKCRHDHAPISEAAKKELQRPTSRSREPSKERPPAANRRPSIRGARNVSYCWPFARSGECTTGEHCKFEHLTHKQITDKAAAYLAEKAALRSTPCVLINGDDDLDIIEIAGPGLELADEIVIRRDQDDHEETKIQSRCGETKKTALCWAYAKGQCQHGDSCKFEHPAESEPEYAGPCVMIDDEKHSDLIEISGAILECRTDDAIIRGGRRGEILFIVQEDDVEKHDKSMIEF